MARYTLKVETHLDGMSPHERENAVLVPHAVFPERKEPFVHVGYLDRTFDSQQEAMQYYNYRFPHLRSLVRPADYSDYDYKDSWHRVRVVEHAAGRIALPVRLTCQMRSLVLVTESVAEELKDCWRRSDTSCFAYRVVYAMLQNRTSLDAEIERMVPLEFGERQIRDFCVWVRSCRRCDLCARFKRWADMLQRGLMRRTLQRQYARAIVSSSPFSNKKHCRPSALRIWFSKYIGLRKLVGGLILLYVNCPEKKKRV